MARANRVPLTPEAARRKRIRGWIPAGIALIFIAAVATVALVLNQNGLGRHVAVLPGVSHFTAAGVRNINATYTARFDLRKVPLASAALQLPPDGEKTLGPYSPAYAELDFITSKGVVSLFSDTFRVETRGAVLSRITTTISEADFASLHSQLYSDAIVGLTPAQLAHFMDTVAGMPSHGSQFRLTVGTGNALGVPTTVSAECAGAKGCRITTVTRLPQE